MDNQGLADEFKLRLSESSGGDAQLHQGAAVLSRWQENLQRVQKTRNA